MIISIIAALIGGIITYFLTNSWKIALVCAVLVLIVVTLNDPARRYMKAFYVVLFPLLSTIYFKISFKTENLDLQAGIKELGTVEVLSLTLIAIICLLLDRLERSGKLKGTFLSIKKNTVGDINGNNNQVNQG
jgi:MFS family permease